MLYLNYTYFVHDTQHLRTIRKAVTAELKTHPLYVFQRGKNAQLQFETNEDAYIIESAIAEALPDYEFINDLSNGPEEILLSITCVQSPSSGDDWGRRWNEDALISEKHLVKKRERPVAPAPHSTFWTFFGEEVKEYKVHIGVVGKGTPDEGYVVINGPIIEGEQRKILSDTCANSDEAFWAGQRLLEPQIEAEFADYLKTQRKRKPQKKPNSN